MNRLAGLMRNSMLHINARKKRSGINMEMRKEIRRLKKINIYSRQVTGEQNDHGWFTPKRYKALGQYIETTRNMHLGTLPIKTDLKKEISVKFVEDAHWNYYVFRNINSQLLQQIERQKSVTQDEVNQLPAHFRQLVLKQQQADVPKLVRPQFLYNAQFNVFLPADERQRMNILLKIENPPQDKNEEDL